MTNQINENAFQHKYISLNTRFILSSKGDDYFAKNRIPVRDLITDTGKKSGFAWSKYQLGVIQKFIISNFITSIEIEREEIMPKSSEVYDLVLNIFYSLLFKKFKPELSSFLFNSDIMKKIRNANPQIKISKDFKFNLKVVGEYLIKNKAALDALKEILAIDAFAIIDNEEEIKSKDQKKKVITYFIEQIEPGMWFLFHLLNKTGENMELLEGINSLLIKYLNKSKIADLVAFTFTEFIQNAELTHFKRLAKMKKVGFGQDISSVIQDNEIKAKLIEHARNTKALIKISILLHNDSIASNSLKLQLIIKNKGDINAIASLKDEKQTKDNPFEAEGEYIRKACAEEKITFRLNIDHIDKTEESVTVFTFLI